MAKRGRKPGKNRIYFQEEQEQAVLDYLSTTSHVERNRIYNNTLKPAFEKMVESIIRKYKLFIPGETMEDTFLDTLGFLVSKMEKFKPGKYKAYSYYGTICKNHLIGRIQEYAKLQKRYPLYDTVSTELGETLKNSDYTSGDLGLASDSICELLKKIDHMLSNPEEYKLKESEIKMGEALRTLLENWDYILTTDGSRKLNKSTIIFFFKEKTGFKNTDEIRANMKKYKKVFYEIKKYLMG